MQLASENDTKRFLEALWIRWSESVIHQICNHYKCTDEQREALIQVLSRPNDWNVAIY
jgi:hypothetical protein